jgi:hypothetical protein
MGHDIRLDEHDDTRSDDGEERDDVQDAKAVQNDVAWAGQGFARQCHLVGLFVDSGRSCLKSSEDAFKMASFERNV